MYHSQRFSGLHDWTPRFDLIASGGEALTGFHANGITTEDGLVALFTGEPPLPKAVEDSGKLFEQFAAVEASVPRLLNGLGYRTVFLTTGDLGFLGKGAWLEKIGFQYTEGHDAPFYDGLPRFHFSAAADEALYERALGLLDEAGGERLFMTVETVTTHHPYVDPESGERSEERTFRYADLHLGEFVEQLEKRSFFDGGYLIVTGDHRSMVPMGSAEFERYGDRAYARVPFAIMGRGMGGMVEDAFSQTDLLPSLRHWLGEGRHCVDRNQGVFLPTPLHRPECIYTRRNYDLDRVAVHCGADEYAIQLNGDRTRYVGDAEGPLALIEQVHRLRLGRGF